MSSVVGPLGTGVRWDGPRERSMIDRCDLLLERYERLTLSDVDDAPTDVEDSVLGLGDGAVDRHHDDVDDHGDERQSKQQVDGGRHQVLGVLRNDVAKADGAERDEGEVERLEVAPVLPASVDERAEQSVQKSDGQSDDRRQIELVVDFVRHECLVELPQTVQLGVDSRHDSGLGDAVFCPAASSANWPYRLPTTAGEQATTKTVDQPLKQRQPDPTQRNHLAYPTEAAGVVEATKERPEELDGTRERLANTSQYDQAQRNADQRVDHCDDSASRRHRVDITIACSNSDSRVLS